LRTEFGWRWYAMPKEWTQYPDNLVDVVDPWIDELGGWEKAAPGARTDTDKFHHRQMIWTACRPGPSPDGISMGSILPGEAREPWWFGDSIAREVHLHTGSNWWDHAGDWYSFTPSGGTGEKLAFLNYRYRELMTLNVSCRKLVESGALPNPFALMSHREFFAEFYATWHDEASKLKPIFPRFARFLELLAPSDPASNQ
jgi:hypothetical protein